MLICFISSCLSELCSLSYTVVFKWHNNSGSELASLCECWKFHILYPCRLSNLVPVYVFHPKTARIHEQTTNPSISCSHTPLIMHIQKKMITDCKRTEYENKGWEMNALFDFRCRMQQPVSPPFWNWDPPNTCSTDWCKSMMKPNQSRSFNFLLHCL